MKQEDVDLLANQLPQTDEAAADLRGSDLLNTLKALKTINMNSLKYGNILKVAKVSAAIFFANSDAPQTVFFAAQAAVEAFRAYSQLLPDHEEQACKWLGQAFYLRNNLSDDKKRELERGLMPKFLPLEPQGNVDELKAVARRANLIFGSRCGKALNAHAAYTGWQTHTALCSPEVTRTSWYDAALKRKDALLDPEAQRKLGRVQEVSC